MNNNKALEFIKELEKHRNEQDIVKMKRFFKSSDPETLCMGLNMRTVFQIAKEFIDMPYLRLRRY
ncbi:DNA alkylation repair protein [Gracilibacillus sp. JCM 18860]|uniref:DNA alkylation repair protein n=1 Tax=Gracilibacillus sp. JCM 18860 TaxID=1306159 RepID=UPI000AD5B3E1